MALSTAELVKTAEEDLADKGLPDGEGEVDILLESPAMSNKATEGYGQKPSDVFCTTIYSLLLFLFFLDKVLLSGLTGLHRAIISLVRQDILFRSPN